MTIQARHPDTCPLYGVWAKQKDDWLHVAMRSQPKNAELLAGKICADSHQETMVVKYTACAEKHCRPKT